jgi:hypothetical protein
MRPSRAVGRATDSGGFRLKTALARVDDRSDMPARPLRRLLAAIACSIPLLLPQAAWAAGARDAGDVGSGPPAWVAPSTPAMLAARSVRWSDVGAGFWARSAIDYVAGARGWMRDFHRSDARGRYAFKPEALERRRLFARSLVKAFAPDAAPDAGIAFSDLAPGDRFYPFANVAVENGWMRTDGDRFRPNDPVLMRDVHRALVLALGLRELAAGADRLHLRDGTPLTTPPDFGTLLIGMRLGLRYNHGDESLDVGPDDALPRSEVAWSLYRAATAPSWVIDSLAPYADITLPNLSRRMRRVVEFGVRYVGDPYIWGGDWASATPSGYCCGYQPRGGFDCSGLAWWVLRRQGAGWDNTPPRPYAGWDLPQRSSAQMAAIGNIGWSRIRPGDALFYDGDSDGTVDHVDTYLGAGWALDSGSSNGGVTITRVANGWYEDHFVHARRIVG